MTKRKKIKLSFLLTLAKLMRIPVEVHGSFFAELKNEASTSGCSTAPK